MHNGEFVLDHLHDYDHSLNMRLRFPNPITFQKVTTAKYVQ